MLSSRKILSHFRIGSAVAVGFFLMIVAILFLLGSDEVVAAIRPRIHLIFIRLLLGIGVYAVIASYTIKALDNASLGRDSWKRWSVELLVLLISVALISFMESHFEMPHPENLKFEFSNRTTGIALVNSALGGLMFLVYEIWTIIEANQKLQTSLTVSEKDRISLELASLQQKLNPHFLFNSLNVLSELMYEDKDKANEFINQFSKVYRYVLDVNDKSFVLVDEELRFLESYVFLQKIRFGDKLKINIDIALDILDTYVPPMAFQLLLENAIKHNEISKQRPLNFSITHDDTLMYIQNNLNPKVKKEDSTGIGQSNLSSTYSLLSETKPSFEKNETDYIVRLPILRKSP